MFKIEYQRIFSIRNQFKSYSYTLHSDRHWDVLNVFSISQWRLLLSRWVLAILHHRLLWRWNLAWPMSSFSFLVVFIYLFFSMYSSTMWTDALVYRCTSTDSTNDWHRSFVRSFIVKRVHHWWDMSIVRSAFLRVTTKETVRRVNRKALTWLIH
jgi:hypothetical protein